MLLVWFLDCVEMFLKIQPACCSKNFETKTLYQSKGIPIWNMPNKNLFELLKA